VEYVIELMSMRVCTEDVSVSDFLERIAAMLRPEANDRFVTWSCLSGGNVDA